MTWKFWERWTPILRAGVSEAQAIAVLDALYGSPAAEPTPASNPVEPGEDRARAAQADWQRRTTEAQASIIAWTQGLIEYHPSNQPRERRAEPLPPRKKTVLAILGGGMYVIPTRYQQEYERHGWRTMGSYGAPSDRQIVVSAPAG